MRVLVCGFAAPSERHCFASSCSASHHEPKPGTIAHAYPFGKSQLAVAPTMRPCAHLKRFDLLFSASLTAWPSPRTPQRCVQIPPSCNQIPGKETAKAANSDRT